MEKRGELTSTQLATIILAIIGFVLVGLGLYTIFEDDSLTNRDLCRLSILSRATVFSAGQQFVPLNCQTEKVCITVDDGAILGFGGVDNSCKQFAGENKNNIDVVEVSENQIKNGEAVTIIQKEVANAMYDCWKMTGQGKLDIFRPGDGTSTPAEDFVKQLTATTNLISLPVKPSCIVCSRVAFSDALYEENKKYDFLKNINFNNFISTQEVPGIGKTYTHAITGEEGAGYGAIAQDEGISAYLGKATLTEREYQDFKNLVINTKFVMTPEQKADYEEIVRTKPNAEAYLSYFTKPTTSNQLSIIFAQIKVSGETPEAAFWNALTTGGIVGAIGVVTGPGSIFNLPAVLIKIGIAGAVSTALAYDSEDTTRKNQAISFETCGKFESIDAGQKGCSLVKLMNWDVNDINSLCYNIEGNL
ncbi:MAG: hypothetical protein AABW71_01840 [Nanoarchaeota archaeon]